MGHWGKLPWGLSGTEKAIPQEKSHHKEYKEESGKKSEHGLCSS